jgi:hypothetical protein
MRSTIGVWVAAAALLSGSAHAGTFKCTDASGRVSYQQQPCPKAATETVMNVGNPSWTLVKSEGSLMGTVQVFFDAANFQPYEGTRRVRFKRVFSGGSSEVKDMYFTHYFDCARALVSHEVGDSARELSSARAKIADRDPGFWHDANGWYAKTNRDYLAPVVPKVCSSPD